MRKSSTQNRFIAARILIGFFGAGILCSAIVTLSIGRLHYANTWGAAVFAPFAIVVGILALVFALRGFPTSLRNSR